MVSSVAGYRGMPMGASYGPSKAAVISLAEVLRHHLSYRGVKVSVINPGFIDTPMTKINDFPMPFMISAEDAARRVITGLERGKFEIAFPWQMAALLKLARVVPYPLFFWGVRTFVLPGPRTPPAP
jgi:short-subunit dehydrogenase